MEQAEIWHIGNSVVRELGKFIPYTVVMEWLYNDLTYRRWLLGETLFYLVIEHVSNYFSSWHLQFLFVDRKLAPTCRGLSLVSKWYKNEWREHIGSCVCVCVFNAYTVYVGRTEVERGSLCHTKREKGKGGKLLRKGEAQQLFFFTWHGCHRAFASSPTEEKKSVSQKRKRARTTTKTKQNRWEFARVIA